jgi:hypothetical protein
MIKIKTLSTAVAFFVAVAAPVFAQDERGLGSRYGWEQMAASSATRSAISGVHRKQRHHHGWSASRYNGHGINNLGVTTNQGRKYNGG